MYEAVDIFPIHFSDSLPKLEYPEFNFKYWSNDKDIRAFVLFTNSQNKVYYSRKPLTQQNLNSILQCGKRCKKSIAFQPRHINFTKIANRFKSDPCDEGKKNADVRLGFKLRNKYLVKAFFTFGLREVERGSAHVIQTLNVPLLAYIHPKKIGKICRDDERVFPFEDLHAYHLSILEANGVYRIPPGVKYVLLTVQKTFFSFDILPESADVPFEYSDPVKHRITRLPGMYDRQPKTPYIEQVPDSDEESLLQQKQQEEDCFYDFFQSEPFRPAAQDSSSRPKMIRADDNNIADDDATTAANDVYITCEQQQQQQPNITYWLIPNPPVSERSVIPVSVHFAEMYRELKNKKMEEDPRMKIDVTNSEDPTQPLDLRVFRGNDARVVEENNETMDQTNIIYSVENNETMDQTNATYSVENNEDARLGHRSADILDEIHDDGLQDLDYLDKLLSEPITKDSETDSMIFEILSPNTEL